jgi:hypothetical protein
MNHKRRKTLGRGGFVAIKKFSFPVEAHPAKAKLESEGIQAFSGL